MAQVPSDPIEIKRAFHRHRSTFRLVGVARRSKLVSLFYAAECGLKYLYMTSGSLTTTIDIKSSMAAALGVSPRNIDLHNIEQLCLSVNLLVVDVGSAPSSFNFSGINFAPYKIHEAARYGVKIPDPYLSDVEQWLENVVQAVDARILAMGV